VVSELDKKKQEEGYLEIGKGGPGRQEEGEEEVESIQQRKAKSLWGAKWSALMGGKSIFNLAFKRGKERSRCG